MIYIRLGDTRALIRAHLFRRIEKRRRCWSNKTDKKHIQFLYTLINNHAVQDQRQVDIVSGII